MHPDHPTAPDPRDIDPDPRRADRWSAAAEQRRRAHRTAWKVGAVAIAVYIGFILSGVIGR